MYVVLYSDGQVSVDELDSDCRSRSWIPMAVLRHSDGRTTVPCFTDVDCARSFSNRNIPKGWTRGSILLGEDDLSSIKSKGMELDMFEFPRLVKDRKDCRLDFEILEFGEKPDLIFI